MSDEQATDAPEPQPPPAQAAAADPPNAPGPGEDALHYNGTDPITLDGITFAPDQVLIVSEAVGAKLVGKNNIRQVTETAESWPHFLGMRARAREGRTG